MKKNRYSEEEIIRIIKEYEQLQDIQEVCRRYNISDKTLYRWRTKYEGMESQEIRKLRNIEKENKDLKALVADLSLENKILKDVNSKKW